MDKGAAGGRSRGDLGLRLGWILSGHLALAWELGHRRGKFYAQ